MNALLVPFAEFSQAIQAQRPTLSPESIQAAIAAASAVPAENGEPQQPVDAHRMKRWLALMGGAGLDYGSTLYALQQPGLKEGNPLMAPFVKSPLAFGALKFGANAGIGAMLNKTAKTNPKTALITALLLGGLQAGIGARNLALAKKAGRK